MKSNIPAASADNESFAALFEESLSRKEMRIGEVITAEVIRVDDNFVVVNAGLKSESYIPADEFRNDRGEMDAKPGDFISVAIESLEDGASHAIRQNASRPGTSWKKRSTRAPSYRARSTARSRAASPSW
jgi:small subunit ribosomal protein S1